MVIILVVSAPKRHFHTNPVWGGNGWKCTPKSKISLSRTWMLEALLGRWGLWALRAWPGSQLLVISLWSSAISISLVLSVVMYFPDCCFGSKGSCFKSLRTSLSSASLARIIPRWPHNRVHLATEPDKDTVEPDSVHSGMDNDSSSFSVPNFRTNSTHAKPCLSFTA